MVTPVSYPFTLTLANSLSSIQILSNIAYNIVLFAISTPLF